jgi:hypothetical protein
LATLLAVTAVAAGPALRAADPVPTGPAFRVSRCTTCIQEIPAIAGSPSGAYSVVWEGSSPADPKGILARVFTRTGAARGGDLQVNGDLPLAQFDPAVAVDKQGNYIVVWGGGPDSNSDIFGQKLTATGGKSGALFKISADDPAAPTVPMDINPAIAVGPDGGFVVVWIRIVPPGGSFQGTPPMVFARRYSPAGAPLGAPTLLGADLVHGDRPDVCIDPAKQAVVVWPTVDHRRPFEPNRRGIAGRRIAAAGALAGNVFTVAKPDHALDPEPSVSCAKGGVFVVAWSSDLAPAVSGSDIVAQRFTKQARPIGARFLVNASTAGSQLSPAVVHDPAGNFFVAWEHSDHPRTGISARRFSAAGAPLSGDLAVILEELSTTRTIEPDLALVGAKGDLLVVWQDGRSGGIFGRRFKVTG